MDAPTTGFKFMSQFMKRKGLPKCRVTKISDCENPKHPKHIKDENSYEGLMYRPLAVGESFYIGTETKWTFASSVVEEILDNGTFRTMHSLYKIEMI